MREKKENLYIVIPAYNEEETITAVAKKWHKIVEKIGQHSKLVRSRFKSTGK